MHAELPLIATLEYFQNERVPASGHNMHLLILSDSGMLAGLLGLLMGGLAVDRSATNICSQLFCQPAEC